VKNSATKKELSLEACSYIQSTRSSENGAQGSVRIAEHKKGLVGEKGEKLNLKEKKLHGLLRFGGLRIGIRRIRGLTQRRLKTFSETFWEVEYKSITDGDGIGKEGKGSVIAEKEKNREKKYTIQEENMSLRLRNECSCREGKGVFVGIGRGMQASHKSTSG